MHHGSCIIHASVCGFVYYVYVDLLALLCMCIIYLHTLFQFALNCMCLHCSYKESCTCTLLAGTTCGPAPDAPANGQRSGSGSTVGSTVTYTCNPGYTLQEDGRLTCMANGQWSERAPICDRKLLRKHMFHYRYNYIDIKSRKRPSGNDDAV